MLEKVDRIVDPPPVIEVVQVQDDEKIKDNIVEEASALIDFT